MIAFLIISISLVICAGIAIIKTIYWSSASDRLLRWADEHNKYFNERRRLSNKADICDGIARKWCAGAVISIVLLVAFIATYHSLGVL